MSKLSFRPDFHSRELYSLDLPVEVLRSNLTMETRSFTSKTVDVQPGTYYVTAKLPAGQELTGYVQVAEGESKVVSLKLDPSDESPHETEETQRYLWGQMGYEPILERLGGDETEVKFRAFEGNILKTDGRYKAIRAKNWLKKATRPQPPGVYEFEFNTAAPRLAACTLLQFLQPDAPAINIVLPAQKQETWHIVVSLQPDETYSLDVYLQHKAADALLRYCERGLLEQVAVMATSQALEVLYLKKEDPIAAASAAYVLLRLDAIEQPGKRTGHWLENLRNWFPWLPDGAVACGEYLARKGRHKDALAAFLELSERGLPLFSDGLSYAVNRLKLYIGTEDKHFEPEQISKAKTLLQQLQRVLTYTDFHKAVLTFKGVDPNRPSNQHLDDAHVQKYGGIDLTTLLG